MASLDQKSNFSNFVPRITAFVEPVNCVFQKGLFFDLEKLVFLLKVHSFFESETQMSATSPALIAGTAKPNNFLGAITVQAYQTSGFILLLKY